MLSSAARRRTGPGSRPRRGFSLLEASAAMALFALFVAVFISLSSRLASAQSQQAARAAALGHLQDCLERVKQQGPANWSLPLRETIVEQGATYEVEIEQAGALAPDRSFGRIVGRVRWGSVTGDRMIEREVWVHEHLY